MLLAPSADTVIVSFTAPTSRAMSARAVAAARTRMPVRSAFLKFAATTSMRYVPGLRLEASYRPAVSVSLFRTAPVASSTISTAAPLTAAPCGSATVPRMVPRKDCARAGVATEKMISGTHVSTRRSAPRRASTAGAKACVRIVFLSSRRSSSRRSSVRPSHPAGRGSVHLPTSRCTHNKLSECAPLLPPVSTVL